MVDIFPNTKKSTEKLRSLPVQKEIIRQLKDIKDGKLSKDKLILHPEV